MRPRYFWDNFPHFFIADQIHEVTLFLSVHLCVFSKNTLLTPCCNDICICNENILGHVHSLHSTVEVYPEESMTGSLLSVHWLSGFFGKEINNCKWPVFPTEISNAFLFSLDAVLGQNPLAPKAKRHNCTLHHELRSAKAPFQPTALLAFVTFSVLKLAIDCLNLGWFRRDGPRFEPSMGRLIRRSTSE